MTETPSPHERARRLPWNFAWIAIAIHAALFLVNLTVRLLPFSPHSEQMRNMYAMPGVLIPMLSRVALVWLLAATLAWCHARKALDERGTAGLAHLPNPESRFAAVYLSMVILNVYVLSPLLYQAQLLFMPGGPWQELFGTYPMRSRMAMAMSVQSLIQMAVMVLSVWLAAWFALRRVNHARADASAAATGSAAAGASSRRVVALIAAAVFVSLQMWAGSLAGGWIEMPRDADVLTLLVGWVAVPLGLCLLAFWGGWLGAAPQPAQVRPFRAVAAAVLAFVLLHVACVGIALGWLWWVTRAHDMHGGSELLVYVVALAVIYLVLLVLFMRGATRWLYRRYL